MSNQNTINNFNSLHVHVIFLALVYINIYIQTTFSYSMNITSYTGELTLEQIPIFLRFSTEILVMFK